MTYTSLARDFNEHMMIYNDIQKIVKCCELWLPDDFLKQCNFYPMTGNGKHTTHKNGDLGDGLLLFYHDYPK
jgi:hypothetical protein